MALTTTNPSFKAFLIVAALLRVGLIIYSEWHDARSVVKYTDVDYRVFSDAARFTLNPNPSTGNVAQGPLAGFFGLGDPYHRATYRYTPILAVLLTPNEFLHPSFGKYLFAACDILGGIIIHNLLSKLILPWVSASGPGDAKVSTAIETAASRPTKWADKATLLTATHLFNPMVFAISTRGSSESVLSLFVLCTVYFSLKDRWNLAAIFLGLSTHWKIYPFIYGVACLSVIDSGIPRTSYSLVENLRRLINVRTAQFAALSTGTFAFLGVAMYSIWGYPFVYESYLYHLHRRDHRHNFSPYFYLAYLTYPSKDGLHKLPPPTTFEAIVRSPLISFVPQMGLSLLAGFLFARRKQDLVFTWFVQTFVFVLFNKVCTSQYFLWYLLFLPLLIPHLSLSLGKMIALVGVWAGTQALWLSEAYKLEFLGENVFYGLWVRGLIYVLGNAWVLVQILDSYDRKYRT
ncbi:glycosyltransferase family 50 protein [Thelephora ganbajun]|uniref:Glycosyltransferase family 50 protein n=1 Tax=Thelephora ganbajun TaxID=370292 RepID=A0ACB6ZA27_THEGA|nr:glycosyltransferase family 50 protein [Thelephora ganbajun]